MPLETVVIFFVIVLLLGFVGKILNAIWFVVKWFFILIFARGLFRWFTKAP